MGEIADDHYAAMWDELDTGEEDEWYDSPYAGRSRVYGPPIKCNRCGAAGLYWQRTAQGHQLHNKADLTPHVCPPPSADEFEDLTQE